VAGAGPVKATKSRDGQRRFTMHIPVRVGATDLAACLAYYVIRDDPEFDPDDPPKMSRAAIERIARDVIRRVGHETYGYWQDGEDEDVVDAVEEWTTSEVARLFPELGRS
jgi:hypothetical protein